MSSGNTSQNIIKIFETRARVEHITGDYYTILVDFKNAFNDISRAAILDGVATCCPGLLKLVQQLLKDPTTTLYDGVTYTTNRGTPQGNVLSPLLFSLGIRKGLEAMKNRVATDSESWQMAFLDDVTLMTPLSKTEVITVWTEVDGSLEYPTKLVLNEGKTQEHRLSEVRRQQGINVLGTHVGPFHTTMEFLKGIFQGHQQRITALKKLTTNATCAFLRPASVMS